MPLRLNNTGSSQTIPPPSGGSTATILPGQLVFNVGNYNDSGVKAIWTAPTGGGTYTVNVTFARPNGGDANVRTVVVTSSSTLLDTTLNSSTPVSWSGQVTLAGGQGVMFYAGCEPPSAPPAGKATTTRTSHRYNTKWPTPGSAPTLSPVAGTYRRSVGNNHFYDKWSFNPLHDGWLDPDRDSRHALLDGSVGPSELDAERDSV